MSDAGGSLHFLPWLRSGAASAVTAEDPLQGGLPASATLAPWVRISGRTLPDVPLQANLRGPGHVQSLGAQTIVRCEPPDGTPDFEPNYFPHVELSPADLPWRYTPAAAGERGQLRPWLVLVVVRQQPGVEVAAEAGLTLPVLRIDPGAGALPSRELPDLSDSAAWAHVQSPVEAAALPADPTAAIARLLCPRRLQARAAWHACVVPAFEVGRLVGLGEAVAGASETQPAWDLTQVDQGLVQLPVYYHWTFSTAANGDFESLARRLVPEHEAVLGRADLDVTDPGPPLPKSPATTTVLGAFVGALKTPGVTRGPLSADLGAWYEDKLPALIDRGATRPSVPATAPRDYRPARDDPVVAPPLYGSYQADRYRVPPKADPTRAWLRPLNLDPQLRAIAGLGARVVRANQEALMASAWAQAGALRETTRALSNAQLVVEVGRSLARRTTTWEPGAVVQAMRPALPWVASPASAGSLAADLAQGSVPQGLVGPVYARIARPGTALARIWTRRGVGGTSNAPATASTQAFLDATGAAAKPDLKAVLGFAETSLPAGAWTQDAALALDDLPLAVAQLPAGQNLSSPLTAVATRFGPLFGPSGTRFDGSRASAVKLAQELAAAQGRARPSRLGSAVKLGGDLTGARDAILSALDPLPRVQAGLLGRVPALAANLSPDRALPRRLALAPVFTDPLCWDLAQIDSRFLLPGADKLKNNRVTLLDDDADFIAALLVGANHEMGRELLWREFPASPGVTFFRRFWDTGPDGPDDIGDIHTTWTQPNPGANLTGVSAGKLTLVLVRGDLIRRYPDAHIYLVPGRWKGDQVIPNAAKAEEAVLHGALDGRSLFLGFARPVAVLRGNRTATTHTPATAGWFVAIEEPAAAPRFGIDSGQPARDLSQPDATWRDLAWGNLVPREGALEDLTHAVARTPLPAPSPQSLDGLTWGHNAAHMAAITWQYPFRLYIHADQLLSR
jgi:hypothetical protein